MSEKPYNANEITDATMIKKLLRLWKGNLTDVKFKTGPCREGAACKNDYCIHSHGRFNGISLVRCRFCAGGNCSDRVMRRFMIMRDEQKIEVLRVCQGLVRDLEKKQISPSVEKVGSRDGAQTEEKSPPYDPSLPIDLSEGEVDPRVKKRPRPDETTIFLVPTRENKKALTAMANDPKFKGYLGVVGIPGEYAVETLSKLSVVEVMSLAPQLEKFPGMADYLQTLRLQFENALLKERLALAEARYAQK